MKSVRIRFRPVSPGLACAVLLLAAVRPAFPSDSAGSRPPEGPAKSFPVSVSTLEPAQGDPVRVEIALLPPPDNLAISWMGRTIPVKVSSGGTHVALIGVDLQERPAVAPLVLTAFRNGVGSRSGMELRIREKRFPVQRLSLPERMAQFDDATLERIRGEAERLEARFAVVTAPEWDLPFSPPVGEFRPAGFGSRRIINGEARSPHAGVDVFLPEGTPVVAVASGTVAFAGDQFFGGNSVVLDHGGGVFSVYYHLREYAVETGRRVAKGEAIGSVGSSGRATGPHLHFSVRVPGGRIDPAALFGPAFR